MYAYSYADGICANYPIKLPFCQALFPDSLLVRKTICFSKSIQMHDLVMPLHQSLCICASHLNHRSTHLEHHPWAKTIVFLHSLTRDQRCVVFCTPATGTPSRVAEPAPRLPGPPPRLGLPQGPGSPAGCVPPLQRAAGAPGHRGLARRARPRSPLSASPSPRARLGRAWLARQDAPGVASCLARRVRTLTNLFRDVG